jgi:hypothetical protein
LNDWSQALRGGRQRAVEQVAPEGLSWWSTSFSQRSISAIRQLAVALRLVAHLLDAVEVTPWSAPAAGVDVGRHREVDHQEPSPSATVAHRRHRSR